MNDENNRFTYSPSPVNGRAKAIVLALMLAAVAVYVVSLVSPTYKGILLMGTLLLAVAAIFLAQRYLFSVYTYSLFYDEEGGSHFLVEQRQGKRGSLVAQIPLRTVISLTPYDKSTLPHGKFLAFCATLSGGEYQILHAREAGQNTVIKLEADAAFCDALRAAVENARSEEE